MPCFMHLNLSVWSSYAKPDFVIVWQDLLQQVSAISSLHDVGIIHGDLNPANVMLDAEGHLVLTNFDCAEFLPTSANTRGTTSGTAFERSRTQYQAPEILLGWTYNFAVDCWGFGMILYFLFFGTVSSAHFRRPTHGWPCTTVSFWWTGSIRRQVNATQSNYSIRHTHGISETRTSYGTGFSSPGSY